MRKLKFRVWDALNKKFDAQIYDAGEQFGHPSSCDWYPQQFTGLSDKNNKEIYEGDILRYFIGPKNLESRLLWKVEYFEDRATFGIVSGNCFETFESALFDEDCNGAFEIIGNIFENPELIK